MNKQQAVEQARRVEERIATAQAEMAELKKIIDTPEPAGALLTNLEPGSGRKYWTLGATPTGKLSVICCYASVHDPAFYANGAIFQSEELADAYAEAIETLLLLRHQPGTMPAQARLQYLIELVYVSGRTQALAVGRSNREDKMNKLSPCFATMEDADRAVRVVGMERILTMFKTLHHIEG